MTDTPAMEYIEPPPPDRPDSALETPYPPAEEQKPGYIGIAPEDCPEPFWHETHRYCPKCSWTETPAEPEQPALLPPPEGVPFVDDDSFVAERFLSTNTIAEMFEVTNETVRNWIAESKLKAFKLGPIWRVPRSEVVRFANENFGE